MRSTPLNTEAAGAAPPDAFGPFRVLHQIGAGTLGPVFRAYDPEQDRLVAVKLFKLNVPPERAHRFVARLQQLIDADLAHPAMASPILANVVEASPFLAQDFVAADSLDTIVREFGAATAADAARVAGQLASALDFAAAAGVFHGALHPRDVLLVADDARVTGLGIAQALEAVGIMPPVRRPYAAPERVSGSSWDRRADVYSLAAVMVEMMTGRRPSGAGALDGCFDGAEQQTALRGVFARAMAEQPGDRFETALAFADALKLVVDGGTAAVTGRRRDDGAVVERPLPLASVLPLDVPVTRRLPIDEPLRGAMQELLPGDMPLADMDQTDDLPLELETGVASIERVADWDLRSAEPQTHIADAPFLADAPLLESSSLSPSALTVEAPGAAHAAAAATAAAPTGVSGSAAAASATAAPPAADAVPAIPAGAITGQPPSGSSPVWPIPVALLVGMIVGVAVGFFVFANRAGDAAATVATTAAAPVLSTAPPSAAPPSLPPMASASSAAGPAPSATVAAAPPAAPSAGAAPSTAAVSPPPAARASERATTRPAAERGAAPPPRPAATSGRVLVRTSPAGARVQLNGRDVGNTPTTLRTLPFGTHTLRLTRDGYAAEERRVVLSASQPAQSVVVDLERSRPPAAAPSSTAARFTAALTVESRPPGAAVFLDGRRIGTTPLTVSSVDAGSHVVRLELEGYRAWSSAVRVASDERNRVTASLEQ